MPRRPFPRSRCSAGGRTGVPGFAPRAKSRSAPRDSLRDAHLWRRRLRRRRKCNQAPQTASPGPQPLRFPAQARRARQLHAAARLLSTVRRARSWGAQSDAGDGAMLTDPNLFGLIRPVRQHRPRRDAASGAPQPWRCSSAAASIGIRPLHDVGQRVRFRRRRGRVGTDQVWPRWSPGRY